MISHKHKVIFVHIPKCAGSSIEVYFGVKPFKWTEPNYENLTGWCPKRKIHLHHATATQLLELELVSQEIWDSYYKFSIVRNPWSRAVSDYYWINGNTPFRISFKNYLEAKGRKRNILRDSSVKEYRGDHLLSQNEFIYIDDKLVVDQIIRLENLKTDFKEFAAKQGLTQSKLPHDKKAKKVYEHYSHFYQDKEIKWVEEKYKKDIELFNYSFDDRRDQLSFFERQTNYLTRRF